MSALLTPKFLTKERFERAWVLAYDVLYGLVGPAHSFGIVVLVPGMEDARTENFPNWPAYPVQPVCVFRHRHGDQGDRFLGIAECKALQLWTERNDGGAQVMPHLLFPGDTPYWGGVKRAGIVVACSGFDEWYDKMLSSIFADIIIGLARDAFEADRKAHPDTDFLS